MNPQEQRARDLLAQGLFRKARDEFKVLCKTDRTRYLPWLIEANCGLARAMVAKGMKMEAMQVLSYLKTLGPSVVVQALEIELGADSAQTQGGLDGLLSLMADPNLPPPTRQRLADQAVLRFELPAEATPPSIAGELGAIIKALRAISERQFSSGAGSGSPAAACLAVQPLENAGQRSGGVPRRQWGKGRAGV